MENDELKSFIKQCVREAFGELLSPSDEERRYEYFPRSILFHRMEDSLHRGTNELESQVGKLSMMVSKLESWSSSGCKYDAADFSQVKVLLDSINNKLP